ncbi:primosomal protein N' [Aquibacillus koreensis]|uniref:Replication restart protein PriA n=1 Tax=Aquibacillus koreensis TaxID=279446 RepID=A0A9X3WIT1_9BACI|nr:primosomal protein N' [Aquibacillus koreensis]MCT2538019.1 primosomal protein N' [Aquibacillus koreensis]MDC3420542.1 primosomal protein N' [Aquibacillus koreensis]
MNIAKVVVDVPATQTNRVFDYKIPSKFQGSIHKGMRVIVPFGPRKIMGFVLDLVNESEFDRLKEISDLMDVTPVLTEELLDLGEWLSEETLSFYISSFQAMLPQVLKAKYKKELHCLSSDEIPVEFKTLFAGRDFITYDEFVEREGNHAKLQKAIRDGLIEVIYQVQSRETIKKQSVIRLNKEAHLIEEALEDLSKQAAKQRQLLHYLLEHSKPINQKTLLKKVNTTRASLKPLLDQGLLLESFEEVYREPYEKGKYPRTSPLPLTNQQEEAIQPILNALENEEHHVFLLHGVTGSGKTEVYLQSIQEVIEKGQEAIVLVPEIALTPQMVERFKGRFGSEVAVLHSALSAGEKYDEWRKIQRKQVKVVVGARSAIFAPFENVGIIIIDEEHETSYKQEDHPRYHARDVAIYRGEKHRCPVVLGSATPTLESFARAKKGVYHLLSMGNRMNNATMPTVDLVDMREELHKGNRTMFSIRLKEAMEERLKKGEQIVLFLNRRGYSTFVMCRDCGYVIECPHCDIALTYHRKNERLKCHYCAYEEKMPSMCPECESDTIRYFGTGTQKVEEALAELLPEARVIRMDVDTTRRKGSHERLLTQFARKEADILLGTQMIAKGLDFGNVTLVGVLAADSLLHLPDFRASEKTFQLLTQVSGRAGRHALPGEVVVQTYTPEHYSVQLASQYDYEQFFSEEMKLRKSFQYPPYYFLTLITVSHVNQVKVMEVTRTIVQLLQKHLSQQTRILGPTPSPLTRVKDRYRFQCMVKYKNEPNQRKIIKKILTYFESDIQKNDLLIQVDLQPYQLM